MNNINMGANVKYLLFLTILVLSACSSSSTPDNPVLPQSTSSTASLDPALPLTHHGEQIVARVNQQPITLIELERALERYPNLSNQDYDRYLSQELDKLINQAIINQLAEARQITVQPSAVDHEYNTMRQIMPDDATWEQWLTDNRFINGRDFWLTTLDALTTARLQESVLSELTNLTIPQLKARHILVDSHEQAVIAYNRLQVGEDFAFVASELSLDQTTRANGGDLSADGEWFTADELIVPELAEIAMNQTIGEYSQPFETALGWHIIQTLDKSARTPSDAELALAQAQAFEQWLQEQINQAHIERYIE